MCFNSFWHFYALQIPNSATFVWSAPSFHVILDQKHVVSRPFLSSKNPYFQNEAKCKNFLLIMSFIIRCKFFFLFIGRELTSWPANKCLQIMVCSCALSSNFVWLQIIVCLCVNETTLFSLLQSLLSENGRLLHFPKIFLKKANSVMNDKAIIIEVGYRKISCFISVSQINYLPQPSASANNWSARHWQIRIFCSTSFNNSSLFAWELIKEHVHVNGFALSLDVKQRRGATRKWPII